MNPKPIDSKRRLLDGVEQLINNTLPVPEGPTGYKSKTTAKLLSSQSHPSVNLQKLVEDIWKQMVVNWVEGGCKCRGRSNWRWMLRENIDPNSTSPEIRLQRKFAKCVGKDEQAKERWSNETPTASGFSEGKGGEPGHLDLAYSLSGSHVTLIELKVDANTPVAAAIQLVIYALMLVLAQTVNGQVQIIADKKWLDFRHANLRVVAPKKYYQNYLGLEWFEDDVNKAVQAFGKGHKLQMNFEFRCLEDANTPTEEMFVERLGEAGKIKWLDTSGHPSP